VCARMQKKDGEREMDREKERESRSERVCVCAVSASFKISMVLDIFEVGVRARIEYQPISNL